MLARPAAAAGGGTSQDEGGFEVGTAEQQSSEIVTGTAEDRSRVEDEVCNCTNPVWAPRL